MKIQEKVEIIIIAIIAFFCIIISVLDFLGALEEFQWLYKRISIMTLLSLGVIALYLVSTHFTKIASLDKSIVVSTQSIENNIKVLLSKINLNNTDNQILETINGIWKERENEIKYLLRKAHEVPVSANHELLKKYLQECENEFENGFVFGTQLWRPWDINITAIDMEGKIIYHTDEKAHLKKYEQDHPAWKALMLKNGTLFWLNNVRGNLAESLNIPHRRNYRFTKLYFEQVSHLQVVVIVQSHINVIPYVLKSGYSDDKKRS